MGGERTQPVWVVALALTLALAAVRPALAICPARCQCNEDALQVSCESAALEVVPIQLNPEVNHIDLSHNKISSVHFTFTFYDKLVSLDLSVNKIQKLGSGNFDAQRNMKHLNLSSNEVVNLSKDSFKGLRALVDLDLSFNRLEEISAHSFRDLHSLEVLRMTGNQIVYLEGGLFKPATMLRELHLESNQFLEVPSQALADAYNLQWLSLSRNLIVYVDEGDISTLPELQVLLLDSNVISDLHHGALSGLSSLEYLDLSNNNFTVVPTVSLAKLSNLTKLKFSDNFISTVPPVAFRGLFQLRFLRLDRLDFLTHIDSRAFVDNINLEAIWLDDNIAVESLPSRLFHGNPRITHVSVKNNQIATLDASHFPLDQLRWLQLGGNPLQCNCSLLWLWHLEHELRTRSPQHQALAAVNATALIDNDLSIDIEDIRCAGPEPLRGELLVETSESQVGCSLGWIAVTCGLSFTFVVLAAAMTLYYCGSLRKRLSKTELPPLESSAHRPNGPTLTLTYSDDPRADKYFIGPPLIREYRTLAPWDPYATKHCGDIYRHFDTHTTTTKSRPHIVYV